MPGLTEAQRRSRLNVVAWAGGLTTLLALFAIVEIVRYSNVYGRFSLASVLTLLIVLGAGPVVYGIVSMQRKRNNSLDLSMAMRSLPPE